MSARGTSLKHRVRVAKKVLIRKGCVINQYDEKFEVTLPSDRVFSSCECKDKNSEQDLIKLALHVLRAEKETGMHF